jgi:hypothetical protein
LQNVSVYSREFWESIHQSLDKVDKSISSPFISLLSQLNHVSIKMFHKIRATCGMWDHWPPQEIPGREERGRDTPRPASFSHMITSLCEACPSARKIRVRQWTDSMAGPWGCPKGRSLDRPRRRALADVLALRGRGPGEND